MNRVFVYGSLRAGLGNHRMMDSATFRGAARTEPAYTLVDLGAYPGLLEGGATSVTGELYEVNDDHLARLDAFEGVPTHYRRQRVRLLGGAFADAYVLGAALARGRTFIESGDWSEHYETIVAARRIRRGG